MYLSKGGEVQESTAFIPIVLSPFNVDLSRTRLFYTPKYPLQAVVKKTLLFIIQCIAMILSVIEDNACSNS